MKSSLLSVGSQLSQGHWREGSALHRSWIATRVFPMASEVLWSMTISLDTICNRTTDPEMALDSSLGLNVTMALTEA